MYFLFATSLLIALAGCSSVSQQLDPAMFYKRDIFLEINGSQYEGVTVAPYSTEYSVTIVPPGDIDLAVIQTCHRDYSIEKADSGWFNFGKKKKFTYTYVPIKGIEDVRVCPLRVAVFESDKGRNSWAMLEFENPRFTLQYNTMCNGESLSFNGVGACQARAGTVQRLIFPEPVRFAPISPSCATPQKVGDTYEIKTSVGECLYMFDSEDKKIGRLTLVGFEGILVREAQ